MRLDSVVLAGLCGAALLPAAAWAAVDPVPLVAQLRQSCPSGSPAVPPCFTTTTALNDWIWNVRKPDASRPLTVEIGAGTYDALRCTGPANGHVTFRGIGASPAPPGESAAKIRVGDFRKCAALVFENLAFEHLAYEGTLRFAADGRTLLNAPAPSPSPSSLHLSYGAAAVECPQPAAADAAQAPPSAEAQQAFDDIRSKLHDPAFTRGKTLGELAATPEFQALPPGLRQQLAEEAMAMRARGELPLRAVKARADAAGNTAQ